MKANLIEMLKAQGFSEVESKSETIQQCNGVILSLKSCAPVPLPRIAQIWLKAMPIWR